MEKLLRFLHKFFNKENIPWVHLIWRSYNNSTPQATSVSSSFWWKDIVKLCAKFKRLASCSIALGDTVLF
jgi:phosphatidate phosphatase APP1